MTHAPAARARVLCMCVLLCSPHVQWCPGGALASSCAKAATTKSPCFAWPGLEPWTQPTLADAPRTPTHAPTAQPEAPKSPRPASASSPTPASPRSSGQVSRLLAPTAAYLCRLTEAKAETRSAREKAEAERSLRNSQLLSHVLSSPQVRGVGAQGARLRVRAACKGLPGAGALVD